MRRIFYRLYHKLLLILGNTPVGKTGWYRSTIYEEAQRVIGNRPNKRYRKMNMENNSVHLCKSCVHQYPECEVDSGGIIFGDDVGNDNICCCNRYLPLAERDQYRGGLIYN